MDHSQLYEQVVHVPLALAGPGVAPGRARAVVSTIDIAPTLLDYLELPPLPSAQGRSLMASLPELRNTDIDLDPSDIDVLRSLGYTQ